ncbi:MAG: sigma-70 family RNA polymerase sigma factor [Bacteroidales bacterium]|nr:sigma-70 family RNA polymerase sigma factor [Bacteroidales bacterium]MBS3775092.1 sigma-70 family RNA polymerase sigma factor [Bacteroidales bacterium]
MSSFSDEYYIERVLQGDHSSYATLVERHKDMIFTIAHRMLKNREEAEEIAQDTFMKAYRSLRKFRKESKFSTWLYRIVYNLSVSQLRKNKEQMSSLDDDEINIDIEDTHNKMDQIEASDRSYYVNQAIAGLKHDEKTIITLYYQEELSVNEISEIVQLTHSNVKVKLHRARLKLYEELNRILKNEINTLL